MPDVFSARWYGSLTIPRAGRYTFGLASDDGAALTVDGVRLVDNGGRHGLEARQATMALDAGSHQVLLEYTQGGGALELHWSWAREGASPAPIPAWALTQDRTPRWRVITAYALVLGTRALLACAVALLPLFAWSTGWTPSRAPRAWALALFGALAVIHTWPLATDPAHLTRFDNRDAILNTWIVSWVARQSVLDPLHLFDANIFHPERYTLAYSEPLLVPSLLGAPLLWLGVSPVLTSNLLLLAGFTLSGWAMTLVMQRWTGDWVAGLVAGLLFAFNAHTLSRIPHLQAQHVEFLPLVLFAFDRVLEAPTTRHALRLAACFVLQASTSIYLLAITAAALVASTLARLAEIRRRPLVTLRALLLAGSAVLVVLAPMLWPYWMVSRESGLVRTLDSAAQYAAQWPAYLLTPARVHQWWSGRFYGSTALFPGVLGAALSIVAIASGTAMRDRRARACLAFGALGVALSFGPALPGYALLYRSVPLLQGIRATARFGYLLTCATAILAGFGVVVLRRSISASRWRIAAPLLVVLAAFESVSAPLGLVSVDPVPDIYAAVPRTPGTVVLELPFFDSRSVQFNAHYMLNSTRHWQPLVNGYSGFQPQSYYDNLEQLRGFPDDRAFERIRTLGVTHLFLHRSQVPAEVAEAAARHPALEQVASFGTAVLYRVRR